MIAVAEQSGEPKVLKQIPNEPGRVLKELRKLGKGCELKVCYEAGPLGFGLQRSLQAKKIDCIIVAPSLIPIRSGERIKTDRRDACKLAHFLRSGDLTPIWIPCRIVHGEPFSMNKQKRFATWNALAKMHDWRNGPHVNSCSSSCCDTIESSPKGSHTGPEFIGNGFENRASNSPHSTQCWRITFRRLSKLMIGCSGSPPRSPRKSKIGRWHRW